MRQEQVEMWKDVSMKTFLNKVVFSILLATTTLQNEFCAYLNAKFVSGWISDDADSESNFSQNNK